MASFVVSSCRTFEDQHTACMEEYLHPAITLLWGNLQEHFNIEKWNSFHGEETVNIDRGKDSVRCRPNNFKEVEAWTAFTGCVCASGEINKKDTFHVILAGAQRGQERILQLRQLQNWDVKWTVLFPQQTLLGCCGLERDRTEIEKYLQTRFGRT